MRQDEQNNNGKKDKVGMFLLVVHIIFIALSVFLVFKIFSIQLFYSPDPELEKYFTPRAKKQVTDPVRGSILAMDGKLLASSTPKYQIYMDCTVRKEEYAKDHKDGKKDEKKWLDKAEKLSEGLHAIYKDKSAKEYYQLIKSSRVNGRKHVKIGGQIDHQTLLRLKQLPLFNESSYKGGLIVEKTDTRQYPYGALARRTIGYVRNNSDNSYIGLEGNYNYILHGKEGYEWQKLTDMHGWVRNYDSTMVKVENGIDIKTTIDVNIQDIADKALRQKILDSPNIEGGCVIVMDVKTGGVRAMVNLKKDKDGIPREIYNYAIGRSGDPGSVFKLVTLMNLLEDGKVKSLEDKVETFGGVWKYNGKTFNDHYIKNEGKEITVGRGFQKSSNNVFRYLTCKHYDKNPQQFIDKLYEYKLNETFDFDIKGLAAPNIPAPDKPGWSGTMLPSIAIGYSITITPLHVAMFYNAVANKGKMMKPYIVSSFEKNGKTVKTFKPVILNGSICSKSTVDTLTRALTLVTEAGTGRGLKNTKCKVAGKTGTAQMPFTIKQNGKDKVVYEDKTTGNKQHQASFVGFFPAENPKYTTIVVLYSKLSRGNAYGAEYAVPVFREIVNEVYGLNEDWGTEIETNGKVEIMSHSSIDESDYSLGEVPSLKGLGLKDAIYTIENCGYKCDFEGVGHVVSQSPSPGVKAKTGSTVKIVLK